MTTPRAKPEGEEDEWYRSMFADDITDAEGGNMGEPEGVIMAAEQRLGALQDELQVQRTEAERLSRLNEQLVAQLAAKNEEILQLRARIGAAADHVPPAGDAPPVDDRVVLNRPATRIENIAMEYKEDSPTFQRELDGLQEASDGLQTYLTQVVRTAQRFSAAGAAFSQAGLQLAASLGARQFSRAMFTTCLKELGELHEAIGRFAQLMQDVQSCRRVLCDSMFGLVAEPLEKLAQEELAPLKELRAAYAHWRGRWESAAARLACTKPTEDPNVLRMRRWEAAESRRAFHLARFDLVRHLNRVEALKKLRLMEAMAAAMFAHVSFSRGCTDLLGRAEVDISEQQLLLARARRQLEDEAGLWAAKREELRVSMSTHRESSATLDDTVALDLTGVDGALLAGLPCPVGQVVVGESEEDGGAAVSVEAQAEAAEGKSGRERGTAGTKPELEDEAAGAVTAGGGGDAQVSSASAAAPPPLVASPTPAEEYQGYLTVLESGFLKSWRRRWLQDAEPQLLCELILSNVRPARSADGRFAFDVVCSRPPRTVTCMATGEQEQMAWVRALREVTTSLLSGAARSGIDGDDGALAAAASPLLSDVLRANQECADCGAERPTWAVLNWGLVVCIHCSSVHRHLGAHISKVRSLTLDHWTEEQLLLMCEVGNHRANEQWQAAMPAGWTKLTPDSSRAERERFITAKYRWKGFLEPLSSLPSRMELSTALYRAALRGLVMPSYRALLLGADVNWCPPASALPQLEGEVQALAAQLEARATHVGGGSSGVAPLAGATEAAVQDAAVAAAEATPGIASGSHDDSSHLPAAKSAAAERYALLLALLRTGVVPTPLDIASVLGRGALVALFAMHGGQRKVPEGLRINEEQGLGEAAGGDGDEAADEAADGAADEAADGAADGAVDEAVDGAADGAADGAVDEAVDGAADGASGAGDGNGGICGGAGRGRGERR